MKARWRLVGAVVVVTFIGFLLSSSAYQRAAPAAIEGPFVGAPVTPHLSARVLDLPIRIPAAQQPGEVANRRNPAPWLQDENIVGPDDSLLSQETAGSERAPAPLLSFNGINNIAGVTPPDPIGAVGLSEYVQLVNATFMAVYSKSGALLKGPVQLNDLWTSGGCASSNSGDPVVVYDFLANRWVVAQFRASGNGICMAVSQTSSALGAFFTYEFVFPQFPDYFKIGAWSDAYYLGSNESAYSAYAIDRTQMLSGLPASFVRFTGETNFLMPATVNGPTPPLAGAPGLFYTFKDNSFHGGVDRLEIFALQVNWVTPASSTFTKTEMLPVTSYTYTVCGFFVLNCIPQPETTQRLDPVSEWPMWPLAYRNFGSHEAMVANFTIDVGNDRAGVRWYELRRSGASWVIRQEGTHAPGNPNRWMGSIGIDEAGNIALGYSIDRRTVPLIFPSLRYAVRFATDPLGTLREETSLVAGTNSQVGSNRWGDYSAMSVDPADNCTFWYTGEYAATRNTQWRTRIGAFKMPNCS